MYEVIAIIAQQSRHKWFFFITDHANLKKQQSTTVTEQFTVQFNLKKKMFCLPTSLSNNA